MTETIALTQSLRAEVHALTRNLGFKTPEATIHYLLNNAIQNEKRLHVARLYQQGQKTLRQCAELLHVDLEEMIDILRDFRIPLDDDLGQRLETVKRLVQQIRPARRGKRKPAANKRTTSRKKSSVVK